MKTNPAWLLFASVVLVKLLCADPQLCCHLCDSASASWAMPTTHHDLVLAEDPLELWIYGASAPATTAASCERLQNVLDRASGDDQMGFRSVRRRTTGCRYGRQSLEEQTVGFCYAWRKKGMSLRRAVKIIDDAPCLQKSRTTSLLSRESISSS